MEFLNIIHSALRWLLLIALVVVIVRSYTGFSGKKTFSAKDNLWSVLLIAFTHTQLLIGLALYIWGPWGLKSLQNNDMGTVMQYSVLRFYAVEHITMMVIAVILIQVGRTTSKKATTDISKYKKLFWFNIIALVLILASIPWPFREVGMGRGWI